MIIDIELINELVKYKKGEPIPNPEMEIKLNVIFGYSFIYLTRRSLVHILQKGEIGLLLAQSIELCLEDFDSVYLSNKNKTENEKRLIIFKQGVVGSRDVAIVIEQKSTSNKIFVVTAMIADEKYLSRKYKKLR